MSPWAILAVVLTWGASVGYAYVYGGHNMRNAIDATAAREERIAKVATDAGNAAVAAGIAKQRPIIKNIRQDAIYEHTQNPIYIDCRLPASGLQRINAARASNEPAGAGNAELSSPAAHQAGQ